MGRPSFRVSDVARRFGDAVRHLHPLDIPQRRALSAMALCRTAALGGHLEVCDGCGHEVPAYNSCRNRHGPSCQGAAGKEWVAQRMERILPVPHFHAVFTLPAELRVLFHSDRARMYDLMLRASARTLDAIGKKKLRATVATTAVLHTWNQNLLFHPHVHCIVTVGISDGRLLNVDEENVPFSRRSEAPLTVTGDEFLRRLLLHVLPPGFRKIRHYGLYAPAAVNTSLEVAREALAARGVGSANKEAAAPPAAPEEPKETEHRTCPVCKMGVLRTFTVLGIFVSRGRPTPAALDSS